MAGRTTAPSGASCRGLSGLAQPARHGRGVAGCAVAALAWRSGGGLAFGGWLFFVFFFVEAFLVAILFVEVQLNAVVEVGLLEHLAQVAGAQLVGQRLLFKVVGVMVAAFSALLMAGSFELLFIEVSSTMSPLPGA